MKLSPIYKARLNEIKQVGIEEGIQQGIQQGVKQEAALVVRLLNRKVGELSANVEARVMGLSVNILEDLGEALLDFDSLDDLIDWLNHH
jgi:predicted transposase YdaD